MKSNKKIVYIVMSADLIHQGHLNIIAEGRKLGQALQGGRDLGVELKNLNHF